MAVPSPAETAAIVLSCLTVLVVYLGVTSARHRRSLERIPIRIHVNGTRGKSTVTRLIAGAFREAGYRTFAKTTGTSPRLILPDAAEIELARCGSPTIAEQFQIVDFASRHGAEVLVIECMAVMPELQEASQENLVRGTCSVITNVRLDHQDQMGETLDEIAWALSSVAPERGLLITAEQNDALVAVMSTRARAAQATLIKADPAQAPSAAEFGREEWADNLALALEVCAQHGVDRATALEGMRKAPVDPGALFAVELPLPDLDVRFVNAFAANDYTSTEAICTRFRQADGEPLFLLVNARSDRVRRSQDLVKLIGSSLGPAGVFLIGDGADLVERLIRRAAPDVAVYNLSTTSGHELVQQMLPHLRRHSCLIGIGNIGGPAEEFCRMFIPEASAG